MSVTVSYKARRRFKSDGRWYEVGDSWEPTGDERKDEPLIKHRFVIKDKVTVRAKRAKENGNQ